MVDIPNYQSIALDIAHRIASGEFPVNAKISGRTLLASQYRVSPETIRKAIGLLKEEGIVEVSQGKEIHVVSSQLAYDYINRFRYLQSVYSLKQELELILAEKKKLDKRLEDLIDSVVNYSDRMRHLTPFNPVEVTVEEGSWVIGKTIADIRLWQFTGATIIALRRGTGATISPGPHVLLRENDRLVVVGDENVLQRTTEYFRHKPE
ncbi:GntR family transcriptional regulator [Brevibacillus sp. SYP-B805]|uniref:TrkA C-terminal domain-containing protein n=1 Tax=Brevibacillus sp. SYP-B805 TaxID=1578199 RepID=UPI0013ED5952|nr:TrkA C-terminal domain-containing protein [Brevibacillus sp. SYP-B805]NGQ95139.1 GntR family transcriptional regulator [Brevibacillus sp. SYP-B805]